MTSLPIMPDEAEVAEAIYHYSSAALTCGRVPTFGSAEWVELANNDPAKHAAVVRAALAHREAALGAQRAHMEASHAISAVQNRPGWKVEQIKQQTRMEAGR